MSDLPTVTFVVACRNEEKYIGRCLDSILAQDYPADKLEILVVDGMSEDGTRKILAKYAGQSKYLRVIDNPDRITPKAFNLGIKNARGEIITIFSAHSVAAPDYVSKCVEYLGKTGADDVGGPMRAVGNDYISRAIAFAYNSPFGLGGGKAHDENYEGEVEGVYPGCWPRQVFAKVGLFNEKLVRNQDLEFDSRIRKNGGKIFLTPKIKTLYYCRSNLGGLWKQNFTNGIWNIKIVRLAPGSLSLRHFVPLVFVLALLTTWLLPPLWLAVVGGYILCNLYFSLRIATKSGLKYLFILPVVFLTLHISYGVGLLAGIFNIHKREIY